MQQKRPRIRQLLTWFNGAKTMSQKDPSQHCLSSMLISWYRWRSLQTANIYLMSKVPKETSFLSQKYFFGGWGDEGVNLPVLTRPSAQSFIYCSVPRMLTIWLSEYATFFHCEVHRLWRETSQVEYRIKRDWTRSGKRRHWKPLHGFTLFHQETNQAPKQKIT